MEEKKKWDKWYASHKEGFNQKRRDRYLYDKEYREKVRGFSKESYQKKRAVVPPVNRSVIQQEGRKFYSISRFAAAIGRSESTVREYHLRGIVPPVLYRDTRSWRLYSMSQVQLAKEIFDLFDRGELGNLSEVAVELRKGWKRYEKREGRKNGEGYRKSGRE